MGKEKQKLPIHQSNSDPNNCLIFQCMPIITLKQTINNTIYLKIVPASSPIFHLRHTMSKEGSENKDFVVLIITYAHKRK